VNVHDTVSDNAVVTLSDGVVTLRPWRQEDAAFMVEAFADPAIRRYNGNLDRQGNPGPLLTLAEAEATIHHFSSKWEEFSASGVPSAGVAFAITDATSGELVGCTGLDDWTDADVAQFGYWIVPAGRGRGYATRSVILLTRWLFELGAARAFLTINADNEDSGAVATRAGFVHEGTMRAHAIWEGQRIDVMWFAALADEWPLSGTQEDAS
jgi:RimJ/RimL family protein N-acetyltransferase